MHDLQQCFDSNRAWAKQMLEEDPEFFSRLQHQQRPQFLWIGCSDSRLPPNEIIGLRPGELFVHRNVANQVIHTDMNCLSVLQYAIEVLRVRHVIVVGHYGCGGVRAAMQDRPMGLIDNWLRHVRDVHNWHRDELSQIKDEVAREDRLCELNIATQGRERVQHHDRPGGVAARAVAHGPWLGLLTERRPAARPRARRRKRGASRPLVSGLIGAAHADAAVARPATRPPALAA